MQQVAIGLGVLGPLDVLLADPDFGEDGLVEQAPLLLVCLQLVPPLLKSSTDFAALERFTQPSSMNTLPT